MPACGDDATASSVGVLGGSGYGSEPPGEKPCTSFNSRSAGSAAAETRTQSREYQERSTLSAGSTTKSRSAAKYTAARKGGTPALRTSWNPRSETVEDGAEPPKSTLQIAAEQLQQEETAALQMLRSKLDLLPDNSRQKAQLRAHEEALLRARSVNVCSILSSSTSAAAVGAPAAAATPSAEPGGGSVAAGGASSSSSMQPPSLLSLRVLQHTNSGGAGDGRGSEARPAAASPRDGWMSIDELTLKIDELEKKHEHQLNRLAKKASNSEDVPGLSLSKASSGTHNGLRSGR